jgi:hypothetical protein
MHQRRLLHGCKGIEQMEDAGARRRAAALHRCIDEIKAEAGRHVTAEPVGAIARHAPEIDDGAQPEPARECGKPPRCGVVAAIEPARDDRGPVAHITAKYRFHYSVISTGMADPSNATINLVPNLRPGKPAVARGIRKS